MNPLFPCDHGAVTHSCIMHDTGRGTLCKNATWTNRQADTICLGLCIASSCTWQKLPEWPSAAFRLNWTLAED